MGKREKPKPAISHGGFVDASGGLEGPCPVPGHRGWHTKASFLTDENHERVYLARLVIEPDGTVPLGDLGEITGKLLKDIRLRDIRRTSLPLVRHVAPRTWALEDPSSRTKLGRPRDRWGDLRLARLARDYERVVEAQDPAPLVKLAKEWDEPVTIISEAIRSARKRRFLTKTAPGRAGGKLTRKAEEILKKGDR
jgi:hypothetical protein